MVNNEMSKHRKNNNRRSEPKQKPEYKIGIATANDVSDIVQSAKSPYTVSGLNNVLAPYDPNYVSEIISGAVESPDCDVLIARGNDGNLVAMMVLVSQSLEFEKSPVIVNEICWWIDSKFSDSNLSVDIVNAAIKWATDSGAKALMLTAASTMLCMARIYVNKGFRLLESIYVKGL